MQGFLMSYTLNPSACIGPAMVSCSQTYNINQMRNAGTHTCKKSSQTRRPRYLAEDERNAADQIPAQSVASVDAKAAHRVDLLGQNELTAQSSSESNILQTMHCARTMTLQFSKVWQKQKEK